MHAIQFASRQLEKRDQPKNYECKNKTDSIERKLEQDLHDQKADCVKEALANIIPCIEADDGIIFCLYGSMTAG